MNDRERTTATVVRSTLRQRLVEGLVHDADHNVVAVFTVGPRGQFKKEVSVGRSLASDRRQHAQTKVRKGQGDRGDTT
jgi:hypothetical protein